jgi:hypothetical protein
VAEIENQKEYTFSNIEPGIYKFRILIDENGNGEWEPGDILKRQAPEPIFFYDKEIPIRANWEIYGEDFSF